MSAYVCAVLFLLPMLRAMQGDPQPVTAPLMARLTADLPGNGPRRHYMRANFDAVTGQITAQPSQDSALTLILAQSNALLIRPEQDAPRRAGDLVPFLPLP